ncbi:Na(+)/H(+) antiporter subunit B [Salinicoccus sesuvii]|uniref:Na(+)/H(+) antiporter subunit B n=1 Tax=Salinicoccus sesuvii TaxID=868281 RepID=A0ABV7N9J7_9STAP
MKHKLKKADSHKGQKQMNDVFLQFVSKVVFFIVIMFSFNLFFAGHYTPGGGFVGGLLAASALILLLIAYDKKTMQKMLPIDFRMILAVGLLFAAGVPTLSFLFGTPFFTHQFTYIEVPVFGEIALHSAVLFDIGVFLTVAATSLFIIVLVGEAEN